jgi:hypothetical protein
MVELVTNIKSLTLDFASCSFYWVRIEMLMVWLIPSLNLHLLDPLVFIIIVQIFLSLFMRYGLEICLLCLRNNTFGFSKKKSFLYESKKLYPN